jgi:hypothetical protein
VDASRFVLPRRPPRLTVAVEVLADPAPMNHDLVPAINPYASLREVDDIEQRAKAAAHARGDTDPAGDIVLAVKRQLTQPAVLDAARAAVRC